MKWIPEGTVTAPEGFLAAGIYAGIKPKKKKDLCLVVSEIDAQVGAAFTTNRIKAAPVKVSMQHARRGPVRAVVINSGNANACTGLEGIQDAKAMVESTARHLGCKRRKVLVCSTGTIGTRLPIQLILEGIPKAVAKLSRFEGESAAKAIRTTDTTTKSAALEIEVDGKIVRFGGMAKGAGMIHPNMATMLAVITTDLAIEKSVLQQLTSELVNKTFNAISVDGDTSTNDTVFVLANAIAENEPVTEEHPDYSLVRDALKALMKKLAMMVIEDGESITHVVQVKVEGAASDVDARRVADAIAHSPLVKSSWAGDDPNWGRLMDVIGYSGARVREESLDIYYDGLCAVKGGCANGVPPSRLKRVAKKRTYCITINLHLGSGHVELFVNDLTPGYVKFNMGE